MDSSRGNGNTDSPSQAQLVALLQDRPDIVTMLQHIPRTRLPFQDSGPETLPRQQQRSNEGWRETMVLEGKLAACASERTVIVFGDRLEVPWATVARALSMVRRVFTPYPLLALRVEVAPALALLTLALATREARGFHPQVNAAILARHTHMRADDMEVAESAMLWLLQNIDTPWMQEVRNSSEDLEV
ncbi:hypothetical protein CF319_g7085 [Tilletia indica]|nr:hypothetical protein CF319_g7085 [Tilletia indica]